jgi:toxin YoeB
VIVQFTSKGWTDYQHWVANDRDVLQRLNALIEDARRNLFKGLGKPEPLKGDLQGWWSRRITGDHRLIYQIAGAVRVDQRVVIAACRYHYER